MSMSYVRALFTQSYVFSQWICNRKGSFTYRESDKECEGEFDCATKVFDECFYESENKFPKTYSH